MKLKYLLVFIAALLTCGLVAWVGGYNFDQRNADAACGLVFSLLISYAAVVATELGELTG